MNTSERFQSLNKAYGTERVSIGKNLKKLVGGVVEIGIPFPIAYGLSQLPDADPKLVTAFAIVAAAVSAARFGVKNIINGAAGVVVGLYDRKHFEVRQQLLQVEAPQVSQQSPTSPELKIEGLRRQFGAQSLEDIFKQK